MNLIKTLILITRVLFKDSLQSRPLSRVDAGLVLTNLETLNDTTDENMAAR